MSAIDNLAVDRGIRFLAPTRQHVKLPPDCTSAAPQHEHRYGHAAKDLVVRAVVFEIDCCGGAIVLASGVNGPSWIKKNQ